ncbi:MAG TPA: glycosyltransferase family 4 protein [Pusillimonas sp.]|uniref:glycosyltransferase family 4 protein n=1 Tax=Pusillimonas sp. TaxID=3040095 RepID=UPI002C88D195|nr:glycosyltransferase family 4 protein [Pusillimonas sp.]HUH88691.1 glycosyltransferase family 4 protein [Pusillimonas sp.]
MKILITDIHHGNGGGHVTYILGLIAGLKERCDVTLAVPPTGRLFQRASALKGIRVLPGLYTSRPLTLLREVLRLRRFLARERFDLVHVNGSADHRHVMLARLGLRHPPAIVWTKHNTNRIDSFGQRMRARFGTDGAIGVSKYVAAQLAHSCYRKRAIHVVYHGVDAIHFAPPDAQQRRQYREQLFGHLPEDALVFGSTGGTDIEKGWMLLVQAIAELPPHLRSRIRVVVAGDPPSQDVLATLAELDLDGSQVVFPGLVKDVRPILGACDIGFVLSYREAASYALYEAMAMGLPGLVSDAGGLPEGIRHEKEGWMVPVGDVSALGERLRAILNECPKKLAAMGASARNRAETMFSVPVFLDQTEQVYRETSALRSAVRVARVPDMA